MQQSHAEAVCRILARDREGMGFRHLEIVLARRGEVVLETYPNERRTAISEPLPSEWARKQARESGLKIIDHTAG
jgi:hypothetical protein